MGSCLNLELCSFTHKSEGSTLLPSTFCFPMQLVSSLKTAFMLVMMITVPPSFFFFSFGNSVDLCVGWRFLWRSENWGYSSVSFFHYWFSHHVSPRALTIVLCNIKLHFFSMFTIGDRLRAKLKGNRVTEGLSETLWSW